MKKILAFIIAIIFCFCSCGKTDYMEIESIAIVSAIGVDYKDGKVVVTMEIVKPKTEEKTAENQIITKSGQDFEDAVAQISGSVSKNLFYSHCAVIAFGENLNKEDIRSVFEFCFLNNEFTLILKIISTKDAKELLSVKPKNEDVLGYEIMSSLNSRQKNLSIGYNNSFINVGGRRDTIPVLYALPFFEVEGEKEEKVYSLKGLKLYLDDQEKITLLNEKAAMFEVLSNSFKNGQLNFKINGQTQLLEIKKSNTKIKTEYKNGKLKIALNLEQTLKNRNNYIKANDYKKSLEYMAKELINISKQSGLDLFFVKEYLKKQDTKIYNMVKDNFEEIYINSEITFGLKIKEEN